MQLPEGIPTTLVGFIVLVLVIGVALSFLRCLGRGIKLVLIIGLVLILAYVLTGQPLPSPLREWLGP